MGVPGGSSTHRTERPVGGSPSPLLGKGFNGNTVSQHLSREESRRPAGEFECYLRAERSHRPCTQQAREANGDHRGDAHGHVSS